MERRALDRKIGREPPFCGFGHALLRNAKAVVKSSLVINDLENIMLKLQRVMCLFEFGVLGQGLSAGLQYSDSDTSTIPTLPNPSTSTNIEFNYRQPLGKGSDNPALTEGLASARAGVVISAAQVLSLYDQLAGQIVELFGAVLSTKEQIANTQAAIERTKRLQKYLKKRSGLGISEEKDLLQVKAQLHSQLAQQNALDMALKQQQISFNRLMGTDWKKKLEFKMEAESKLNLNTNDFNTLFKEISQHSPQLRLIEGQIKLADSKIKNQRDARKDKLDLVLFVGNKTSDGDSASGDVSESDVVGGVRMEYQQSFDASGLDAALYEAQLQRWVAIQEKRKVIEDLHYELASLLSKIQSSVNVVNAFELSLKSEKEKLTEAGDRYRRGRIDTDRLIQFENQMSAASLSLSLQKIELHKAYLKLSLIRGILMKDIKLPEFDLSVDSLFEGEKS